MEIYVVQKGDNINSIAEKYGITVERLIQDNGIVFPYNLIVGSALVIAYPAKEYTVQQGDTLESIAEANNVSVMQILRNNSFLFDRQYIYPGETLVISYDTVRKIDVHGFAYPYINEDIVVKMLPSLTYISIFNYSVTENGVINSYQDDTNIINKSKEYGVVPLMLLTTLDLHGKANYEVAINILLDEESQDRGIDQIIDIMKTKGYMGINVIFDFINEANESLHLNLAKKISNRLQQEGFLFFLTFNFEIQHIDNNMTINKVDYYKFSTLVDSLIIINLVWGTNNDPPEPVIDIKHIKELIDYLLSINVPANKIIIGGPIIGYDWKLPYVPGITSAKSLTINSVLFLANEVAATIEFDEESQSPYFYYTELYIGTPSEHIVWFVDARSINALNNLIIENGLNGNGIWNIMIYYAQLWTIINSQFDINKSTFPS